MKTDSDITTLLERREALYWFLSRLYRSEVDSDFLDRLQDLVFPDDSGDAELDEGYCLIRSYLDECPGDALTDLAVDYARTFLGAGLAKDGGAYPYASIYTSTKRILMQEARDRAVEAYAAEGLCKGQSSGDYPEDHLALLLEFMSVLCRAAKGDSASDMIKQHDFLQDNLMNWIPSFCTDLEQYALTSFYKGVGKMTNAWIRLDHAVLTGLIN